MYINTNDLHLCLKFSIIKIVIYLAPFYPTN